ncbi:peptidoglycan-binding protein [Microbaculum marinum]|uniref:Peptidoglycan-binding protein n=1 Tax=Microbaculum marinum TaxID=1764581 RepID=A0AAW9S2U1_9HYPH
MIRRNCPVAAGRPGTALAIFAAIALVVALAAAALPGGPAHAQTDTAGSGAVLDNVRAILSDEKRQALPIENRRLDLIRYYAADDAELLFVGTGRADQLVARMIDAEYDGLDPGRYSIEFLADLATEMQTASPERLAEIEIWFAAHFLLYSADVKVGRVLPRKVYPDLYMPRKEIDGENVLRALARFDDIESFMAAWEPYNIEYSRLRKALANYLDIRDQGGWGNLPGGVDVAVGQRDERLPAVRLRLDIEYGYEAPSDDADILDSELEIRLRAFQLHHDVPVTGQLDKSTLLALNVPVERRIEQIMLSMERLRWMPEEITERVLIASKGDGLLRLLDEGGAVREWRILPNCPRDNLAIVAGRMRTMVINPSWDVPYDYFQTVLFPLLQKDPATVARRGFQLLYLDAAMPVDALPWGSLPKSSLSREKDKFRFRLMPGAENPYGRFVYRLDGVDGAYLFDAPADAAAEICDVRLSKGAIAVVDGLDLMQILSRRKIGTEEYLERTLERRETLIIPDIDPLPLMIVYQSAWIDSNGNVRFSRDPYQEDLRLTKALEGKEKS